MVLTLESVDKVVKCKYNYAATSQFVRLWFVIQWVLYSFSGLENRNRNFYFSLVTLFCLCAVHVDCSSVIITKSELSLKMCLLYILV